MASQKQKKAIANLVENGGNVSKAMRDAGYSVETAKTPAKLTQSKGFQNLMKQMGVDDEKLVHVLREGLEATETIVMGKESSESFVDIVPDHKTRHKFLETAIKLKGLNKEEATGNTFIFNQGDLVKKKYVKD